MSWFRSCPFCHTEGVAFHYNFLKNSNSGLYNCPNCGFQWESNLNCKFLLSNRNPQCIRDSNIGECKLTICPRLKEIPMIYLGFNQRSIDIYQKQNELVQTSNQQK